MSIAIKSNRGHVVRVAAAAMFVSILANSGVANGQEQLGPAEITSSTKAGSPRTSQNDARPRPLGLPVRDTVRLPKPVDAAAKSEPGFLKGTAVRTALSLAMVLSLILGLAAIVKRVGGRAGLGSAMGAGGASPSGLLEVLGRYPVGRGCTLVLLKVDRRVLLLSQTAPALRLRGAGGGLATLCEITDPEEVASILMKSQDAAGQSLGERFRGLLSRFDSGHDAAEGEEVMDLRRVRASPEGDRVELWDDAREAPSSQGWRGFPTALVRRDDPVGALRKRLETMRTGGDA